MTTHRVIPIGSTNLVSSSSEDAGSFRTSFDSGAGRFDNDDRPIKRRRLDSFSTTSALRQSRSMTPVPNDSNQDANIPDIVASLEMPMLGPYDGFSADGDDDDDSVDDEDDDDDRDDDDRDDDEDESDVLRFEPSRLILRDRRPSLDRAFASTASSSRSLVPDPPLHDDLDDLESDLDLLAERRLPGRRRVPNADHSLEAHLRRQLQLRIGHRAVSKALKIVLLELASRVADQLEDSEPATDYWDSEREQEMASELQWRLDRRLELVANELQVLSDYRDHQLELEVEYLHIAYMNHVASLQDLFFMRTELRALELWRQYQHDYDENGTDDEDADVMCGLYRKPTDANPSGIISPASISRSRVFLETVKLCTVCDLYASFDRHQKLVLHENNERAQEGDGSDVVCVGADDIPTGFGRGDDARRAHAIVALNFHHLVSAAVEIEAEEMRKLQQQLIPVLPNEEAYGLQALAAALEQDTYPAGAARFVPLEEMARSGKNSSPAIKQEDPRGDIPAHLYPLAPTVRETGNQLHVSAFGFIQAPNARGKSRQSTSPTTSRNSRMRSLSEPGHLRTTSNLGTHVLDSTSHQTYGDGNDCKSPNALPKMLYPSHAGSSDAKSSIRAHTDVVHQLADIDEDQYDHQNSGPTLNGERVSHILRHDVLPSLGQRADTYASPQISADENQRRSSEAYAFLSNDSLDHQRKYSAPIAHNEDNPLRHRSPHRLGSPLELQNTWQQHRHSLHPAQSSGMNHTGPLAASTPVYYAVPGYTIPSYVVYGPPPPHIQQATGSSPRPRHGPIFFGPPPPPQFGPPQQHYPWYRQ